MLRQRVMEFLKEEKVSDKYIVDIATTILTLSIIVICIAFYNLAKRLLKRLAIKISEWNPKYIFLRFFAEAGVFDQVAHIVPITILFILAESIEKYSDHLLSNVFLIKFASVYFCIAAGMTICKVLDGLVLSYDKAHEDEAHKRPINSYSDLLKILVYLCVLLTTVTIIFDKSVVGILSGIGALTAVVAIVFRDSLLGLAASIQISAYQLVEIGDWIEMPKFGIDGNVEDISLTNMRVRNFDNSISIVPTHMIISESFRNWRGMEESAGRRIKRHILIDVNTVRHIDDEAWKQIKESSPSTFFDADRRPTNLGILQNYLERFMQMHPKVNQEQRIMARQLQPVEFGVPVQFYCFSLNKNLDAYEKLQSEILEEVFIVLPYLGLKMYQKL